MAKVAEELRTKKRGKRVLFSLSIFQTPSNGTFFLERERGRAKKPGPGTSAHVGGNNQKPEGKRDLSSLIPPKKMKRKKESHLNRGEQ